MSDSYEKLKIDARYSICKEYPYQIIYTNTKRVVKVHTSYNEYKTVSIGGKTYGLHKVIAEQWLDNPNKCTEVNHKDGNRSNNKLDNLEWITHSDNLKQREKFTRRKFEFIDELPTTAEQLDKYKDIEYDRYWFDYNSEKLIIKAKNGRYRYVNFSDNRGKLQAALTDKDGKTHSVPSTANHQANYEQCIRKDYSETNQVYCYIR